MSHDATVVLLGSVGSSDCVVTCENADPASFPAGIAVRQEDDGGLVIAASGNGPLIGVSRGPSLSDHKKTAVARVGNFIPILLKDDLAAVKIGDITFTSKLWGAAGNSLTVTLVTGADTGLATIETDPESPYDIIVEMDDGVTTAQTIVDAIEADTGTDGANSLLTCVIDEGDEAAAQADASETPLTGGSDVAALGAVVKIDAVTGQASADGTDSGAVYLSGALTGMYPDETTAYCAYIAMPGGF